MEIFKDIHNRTKYILFIVMGFCLVLLFVVTVMMLTTRTGRIVSDGEVGRISRKDEIYMKVDDIYKHVDGGNQENCQPWKKGSRHNRQTDQAKKQKERRWEITTPVKIQNEHHHGETKKFIESGADISYLTNHFFCDSFYLSLVTMAIPMTDDDELEHHTQLWNFQALVQEADQPTGNQTHQNYERDNNLSSLVDSHTSSGFNSLTVYDHSESSLTSSPSSYQSGQRRSSVASRSFSLSHQLQVDRPIMEEEQNNGYTDDNIYNVNEPHTSRSMNDQQFPICSQNLSGQEAQQNSRVRGCTMLRGSVRLNTRENRLSSGENTSTVSLRESTCTQRKEVHSSEKTSSRSGENPLNNNSQQLALATPTTTASSRSRPRDQPRMLEMSTGSAICNNGLNTRENRLSSGENTSTISLRESTCTQRKEVHSSEKTSSRSGENPPNNNSQQFSTSFSRSLPHERETPKGHGKQAAHDQYNTTENICNADENQAQSSSQGNLFTTTEDQNERQVSELVANSFPPDDDDLLGEGQSPIPNSDLFELTEENGEEGEDEVNEIMECSCSTGDTREEDLPPDD